MHDELQTVSLRIFASKWTRYGKISLICLHFDKWTYIFDMISISVEQEELKSFINLLRSYLSNPNILKVIQDSRFVADMLYHQYDIVLNNVFDIDVNHNCIN